MAKEFPVGTIRHWQNGDMIKAYDPIPPYGGGWIPLQTSQELEKIGLSCDQLAREILSFKEPINGEKFLDHEINSYRNKDQEKVFASDDFKAYQGFFGAGRYAFRNQFSKLYMSGKMQMEEEVARELQEENAALGGDKDIEKLTPEMKKEIRKRVRDSFIEEKQTFTFADAKELLKIIGVTLDKIKEGVDFKDPKKKQDYEQFIRVANSLPETYERLKVKQEARRLALKDFESSFSDNWGVLETGKDYIDKKFGEYVKKYKEEIKRDSVEDLKELFGVSLGMPAKEFYGNIYKKQFTLTKDEAEDANKMFPDLIYLRFMSQYGKTVEGSWDMESLKALYDLENAFLEFPEGHILTNDYLDKFTNVDYNGGSHGGYAWYAKYERRINFSSNSIKGAKSWGDLNESTEFKSVLYHEIGHSVSSKLERSKYYDYKKFVVECGWSYEQKEIRQGMSATGEDKDLIRGGSNASLNLITDYARKSPEEAFAEYYSFYSINKKEIDKFIETNDHQQLKKKIAFECKTKPSKTTIEISLRHKMVDQTSELYKGYKEIYNKVTEDGSSIKYDFVSPWGVSYSKEEQVGIDPQKIKLRKDRNLEVIPPVVSYREKGSHVIFDGAHRNEVTKMNKKMTPILSISKEMYFKLKESGYSDNEISKCVLTHQKDENLKMQMSFPKTYSGLIYRDRIIPSKQIVENMNVLKQMKKIWESDELKKAIESLFSFNEEKFEKSNVAQVGEIREWQGVKMQKTSEGWVPVKSGTVSKKEDLESTKKEIKPEELAKHAKTASEQALQNAIKNSSDPEMRRAAHEELDRRKREEHVQEDKKEELSDKSKDLEKVKTDELRKTSSPESLKERYKEFVKLSMDDDFSDPKKTKEISNKVNEFSRYIQKTVRLEEEDKEENIKGACESLGLKSEKELQDFLGDGKILAIKHEDGTIVAHLEDAYLDRTFSDGIVEMNEFILNPEVEKTLGKGSDIFNNQVENFRKRGYKELITGAARSDIYNGYYTWARLGYDMASNKDKVKLKELLGNSKDEDLKSVQSLSELMSFQKGRDFWKKNGFEFTGTFDLNNESESSFILKRYMEEKKNAKK